MLIKKIIIKEANPISIFPSHLKQVTINPISVKKSYLESWLKKNDNENIKYF